MQKVYAMETKDLKQTTNDLVETVENQLDGKLIKFEDLPSEITELLTSYFTEDFISDFLQCIKYSDTLYRIKLFSENQEFIIRIDLNNDYIGCVMNNRKPYPGETWIRGNDYPDGNFTDDRYEVMFAILNRIYKNTFCPISENIK